MRLPEPGAHQLHSIDYVSLPAANIHVHLHCTLDRLAYAYAQGSFANGTFAAYSPAMQETELCDVPDIQAV